MSARMALSSLRSAPAIVAYNSMADERITETQARALAAEAMQTRVDDSSAHLVERLDGQNPYYLIFFGGQGGPGATVTLDAVSKTILSRARINRVERPWLIEKEQAAASAGFVKPFEARLVWTPCRATRSMFYPLWELTSTSGLVYVNQLGQVWHKLTPAGPG
jgi:hypothetical protein